MTIALCCPICRGSLEPTPEGHHCAACRRMYPTVLGIADFRVSPPRHFDAAADLMVASVLAEEEADLDFEGLLHLYYRLRPEANEGLHEVHLAHLAGEENQARAAVEYLEQRRAFEPGDAVLEVGCGFGQYLAVAAEQVDHVVGVDLSLPFLVLTRQRLGGRGLVVAAEAERLPFRDGSFAAVIAADVIEHLTGPQAALAEMGRVLISGAPLFLSTPNRFSLAPEPHVGLWGVGYLPRRWANRYIRRRLGITYDDVRMLSVFALRKVFQARFPGAAQVLLPGLSPRQMQHFSPLKRRLARLYLALRRLPVVQNLFYLWGPFFHVVAVKR
ncbi:MAG: methyltransferase domain-containing protein [Acidobacteria bacterium]|nr:methyltransferase domain-containing protein [Acidobacteriota bacterium]